MASPRLESFCCMGFGRNASCHSYNYADEYDYRSINISYNVLCIISSVMSICGASYQLIPRRPRRPPRGRTELESMLRQNVIICWLAIADLLASLGLSYLTLMILHNFAYFKHTDSVLINSCFQVNLSLLVGPIDFPVLVVTNVCNCAFCYRPNF